MAISYAIENTDLFFHITEENEALITGTISRNEDAEFPPFYKVEIWWNGKIKIHVLSDGLNLSLGKDYLEIHDLEEITAMLSYLETALLVFGPKG